MTDTAVAPILPTPDMLRAGVGWRETDTTEGLSPEASQCDRIWRVMVAAAPALPVGGGVEEGMVLVPREPTQAMIDALWDGLPKGFVFSNCTPRGVVASIIEAALSPTTLGGEK